MSSPTLIDDSNTAVQYSHNWTWVPNLVPEVDHTRHGVQTAGQTASLTFTGTGIQVFGTLEPSDVAGQPTTQYAIDGTVVSSYTAPFTPPGSSVLNVTFFSKLDLSSGTDHEIVITNVNGTSPNMFWLDFFLVYTSPSQDPTQIPSSIATAPVTASTNNPGPPSISVKTAGGIIGGVAGGLLIIIAILVAYIVRMRRRSTRVVEPFQVVTQDGSTIVPPLKATGRSPVSLTATSSAPTAGSSSLTTPPLEPVIPISGSTVNVVSNGTPSEHMTSSSYTQGNRSGDGADGRLLPGPSQNNVSHAPEESLSLDYPLLRPVARGQAVDSGLRLYDQAMLPPSYSSS